ncbi:MAG: 3-oxoadipate enol-lactonase [Thermoleophilia bacterium]|nr:3-oxoadipate enol-lactonase [Thermoleophilia bacterium]
MRIAHELHGPEEAPVVVLSSSLGTTRELWAPQIPALARDLRVLAYDHPGHGESDLPGEGCSIEGLARSLLSLLDELELERVSIGGVSLGGMVATAIALEAPERVDRLVLACTSAFLGPPETWLERAATVRRSGIEAIADAVLGRWFTAELAAAQPEIPARFRALLLSTSREGYARCCEAIARWDARERLTEIRAPTLVVAGADDPATPVAHSELLASRIPNAHLVVLERAAHLANVERAPEFTQELLAHLTEGASGG